jgi:hypothetical protein
MTIHKLANDQVKDLPEAKTDIAALLEAVDPIILQHQQPAGTDGGATTTGAWNTVPLNTEVRDAHNRCALAANQFTLPAGTYKIRGYTFLKESAQARVRIRNISDGTTAIAGAIQRGPSGSNGEATPEAIGVITIASPKTFELQYRATNGVGLDGLGMAMNWGEVEVYATVEINKLA